MSVSTTLLAERAGGDAVAALASHRRASAQALYGSIVGTVTDESGALVPGATVTATNTGTGLKLEAVQDAAADTTRSATSSRASTTSASPCRGSGSCTRPASGSPPATPPATT